MLCSLLTPVLILPVALALSGSSQIILDAGASSTGCGSALPDGVVAGAPGTRITTTSHGIEREYLLHVPEGYDNTKQAPLYFSFHGAKRNVSEQEGLSQFSNPLFNPNGIAVYPQGLGVS